MKILLLLTAPIAFALISCGGTGGAYTNSSFDPMRTPGTALQENTKNTSKYNPGEFVVALMDDTAFYDSLPKSDQNANKLLKRGTEMKVISTQSNLIKVELENGDIGFVLQVMVSNEAPQADNLVADEFVVPLTGESVNLDLPPMNADGLPAGSKLPAIIDPEAAASVESTTPPETVTPPVEEAIEAVTE